MAKTRKYQDWLLEKLKDHDEAVAYLNAALEESLKGDEESRHLFLLALRNIAEAQGGMGQLAKKAHVGRESLYKALSEQDIGTLWLNPNPSYQIARLFGLLAISLRIAWFHEF